MNLPAKRYLGDSVYAEARWDAPGFGVKLTTENGRPGEHGNTIYMDESVIKDLVAFVRACKHAAKGSVTMKTLNEHDQERRERYDALEKLQNPHPNGIECPKCREELWDSNPMMLLASIPPQQNVHCPACGYRGYRLD